MKNKTYDIVALGELLIDFTENGVSTQGNRIMEANPGGAPCNVLAMMSKLGYKTAFIGKVGEDMFGDMLKSALSEAGIDTRGLLYSDTIHTTLAFVHTLPDGDREFSFYRNPGADMMLVEDEIDAALIKDAGIFHFGTLSMTHEGCRAATKKAVLLAKQAGAIISFDPNIREMLWESHDEMREQIEFGLANCDILKISDSELLWISGKSDYDSGIAWMKEKYDISLILLSLGKEGSMAFSRSESADAAPFLLDATIETTGAGDTFFASALHYVIEHGLKDYSSDELKKMLIFANAAAAIITTRRGALKVMPDKDEIMALIGSERYN